MRNLLAAISGLAAPSEAQDGGGIFDPGECGLLKKITITQILSQSSSFTFGERFAATRSRTA